MLCGRFSRLFLTHTTSKSCHFQPRMLCWTCNCTTVTATLKKLLVLHISSEGTIVQQEPKEQRKGPGPTARSFAASQMQLKTVWKASEYSLLSSDMFLLGWNRLRLCNLKSHSKSSGPHHLHHTWQQPLTLIIWEARWRYQGTRLSCQAIKLQPSSTESHKSRGDPEPSLPNPLQQSAGEHSGAGPSWCFKEQHTT